MLHLVLFCLLSVLSNEITVAWNPHKYFTKIEIKPNYTTYTHRLLINHPAQISCFKHEGNIVNGTQIFWTHRGFKLDASSPFISAQWDNEGNLMINQVLPRKIYLWCHYPWKSKVHIYMHHLEFVAAPLVQAIYAVEMIANFTADKESLLDDFYVREMRNCLIQSDESGTVAPEESGGIDFHLPVIQKTAIIEAVEKICASRYDCISLSLDFFSCSVNTRADTSFYSIDFSTMHNLEMGTFLKKKNVDMNVQINQVR